MALVVYLFNYPDNSESPSASTLSPISWHPDVSGDGEQFAHLYLIIPLAAVKQVMKSILSFLFSKMSDSNSLQCSFQGPFKNVWCFSVEPLQIFPIIYKMRTSKLGAVIRKNLNISSSIKWEVRVNSDLLWQKLEILQNGSSPHLATCEPCALDMLLNHFF